ncbi:MAG: malonyl-CoA decarboxylase [Rhodanobacteraceae bacterium]
MAKQLLARRRWWLRLWASIADHGQRFAALPPSSVVGLERVEQLTKSLLSGRGEASGAALARELLTAFRLLSRDQRVQYYVFLAQTFHPDEDRLTAAAQQYLETRSLESAAVLARASEPPRQEVLRRINMADGGTAMLVDLRGELHDVLREQPSLRLLDDDLRHLFSSWFNRGFLELRRIDWQTSAAILEKLIAYEAVHEISGWKDLHRRLAADRRCFAFFHPALPDEPLIFVEIALTKGLAGSVQDLLAHDVDEATNAARVAHADSAIFYSISNCQDGLRGISFGNLLIKQVVEELRDELPGLTHFATLSPVPGLRRWVTARLESGETLDVMLTDAERSALMDVAQLPATMRQDGIASISAALATLLRDDAWTHVAVARSALRPALVRLTAIYLTRAPRKDTLIDPVAHFHLGNGARLERINWMANADAGGIAASYGIMVNYLYNPLKIEENHEAFARGHEVVRAPAVDALLSHDVPRPAPRRMLHTFIARHRRDTPR